jgi:ribonuclease Z
MLGRTADLHIYGPKEIENYLSPILTQFNKGLPFKIHINPIDPCKHVLIMEDRLLRVYSIPLKHRIPACGFLFDEKQKEAHLIREMVDFYQIPVKYIHSIKQGEDYITPEGETIPNVRLTRPAEPARRYAYCSDTAFNPDMVPLIKEVDLLYHEATFTGADLPRAKETFHSTAAQAAEIACMANVKKLLIGHFSARYEDERILQEESNNIFPDTILANEGLVLPV